MSLGTSNPSLQQSAAYQELVQTLEMPGCPLCTIAQGQVRSHIGGILWDSVNDPAFRTRIDASMGLCSRHSREMLTFTGERLAISIVQQAVVKAATRQLRDSAPEPRPTWADRWRQRLARWFWWAKRDDPHPPQLSQSSAPESHTTQPDPTQSCPACEMEARTEARVSEVLIRHLENDLDARLIQAGGLCRPHLYYCLTRSPQSQHAALINLHVQLWQTLGEHLGEFIRKRDHRFSHEPITDPERDAVERSVKIITGGDPLYPPRKESRR